MTLTFDEAIAWAKERGVKLPSEYLSSLQDDVRGRAFTIMGIAMRDQLNMVLESLILELEQGGTFEEWKDRVTKGEISINLPEHRLDNIFRTNMQVHYNAGHYTQQTKFKKLRPYLMYDSVNDSRTRPTHLALDNVIRPFDDPFWATHYPPNGFRCRCVAISLTEAQAKARGGVTEEPATGWAKPDKGWAYNPGADPNHGIEASASQPPGGSMVIQEAMRSRQQK